MEADIARMVVDLGVATRDIVSAPEERGGGRRGGGGDWRAEERAMKAAQAHREQARSGPEDNARAQMLKKWNTEETFGSDASLENRMDGQGHRARLEEQFSEQQARCHDRPPRNNYRHGSNDLPPPGRGRPSEQDRTPRNFDFAALPPPRTAPAPDPNRVRAPSPRAAGRVRFQNGQRVTSSTTPASTAAPPPRALAAMRPSMPTQLPTGRPSLPDAQPTQAPRPSAPVPLPTQTTRPAPAVSAPSRPIDAPQPARTRATPMLSAPTSPPLPRTAVTAAAPAAALQIGTDPISQSRLMLARNYIEAPSQLTEDYYNKQLDEAIYVNQARKDLVKEAVECVRDGTKEAYISTHPPRKWMVKIAETALNRGDPGSGTALTRLTVLAIIRAAIEHLSAPSTPALPPSAPAATAPQRPQSSVSTAAAAPASAPTPSTTNSRAQPRPTQAPPTLRDMVRDCGDLAVQQVAASRRAEGSQITSSIGAADGTPSRRDSAIDLNSPGTAPRAPAAARAPAVAPHTAVLAPQGAPTRGGMLTATYQDVNGTTLNQRQILVDAPVVANVTFTSTRHHYDPRQLIHAVEALAQEMADRSMGNFRRANDGLWAEAEALGLMD
ncbi:hypothetical protein CLAFUW4_13576 [Fulvia fulva]|uniref:uncharacterized protein n=1 Tax=Passalora fulva TaxID=5499 RepID=UPI00285259E9|nr:uncharacterized protein CLAFUR5_20353 [Fulvia fulva]KAK4610760.1 hypothetical protein CLAFUR4_13578 [Fulvia fulva]KAK4610801.1 hypothetical protein CLAFUR0_13587 [Fulvia fulva]WMI39060.1 hypothetical protein CLAFUR5_20353 [Fulvia fulva]WPV21919.1 hypothetical protein CLAFUW4_13576 [Fulvia fulva]WPV36726.1 hypothetical protein CLAFUW7_13583 [Fulvia fulva]